MRSGAFRTHLCVCVCALMTTSTDRHQTHCCARCFHNALLQLYSWYGEYKIHVYHNQKFIRIQICSKQNQTTKEAKLPHTQTTDTHTNKGKQKKPPKPSHGYYKTQKLLILEVQAEMCSKHRNSRRTIVGILSEEKRESSLTKCWINLKYCEYLL